MSCYQTCHLPGRNHSSQGSGVLSLMPKANFEGALVETQLGIRVEILYHTMLYRLVLESQLPHKIVDLIF